jgi:hypothetical protein
MRLDASNKPYEALGIADVVSLGMVSGHTFVFKPVAVEVPKNYPDQLWLCRWTDRPDLPVGMVVADNHVYMDCVANMSLVQAKVSLRMNAVQCAELAALLLNAAMVLETQAQTELAELEADRLAQVDAGVAA